MAAGEGIQRVDIQDAQQLMVFGRGILTYASRDLEDGSRCVPGTISEHHPDSWASYANPITAHNAVVTNPGQVETVTYTGRYTFALRRSDRPTTGSEALAMYTVANQAGDIPSSVQQHIESGSMSTAGNWCESVLRYYVSDNKPLVVIAPKEHLKRIIKLGEFVVPELTGKIRPIASNDKYRPASDGSRARDALSAMSYKIAMRGIEPGDVMAIRRADRQVQAFFEPIVEEGLKGGLAAAKILAHNLFDK